MLRRKRCVCEKVRRRRQRRYRAGTKGASQETGSYGRPIPRPIEPGHLSDSQLPCWNTTFKGRYVQENKEYWSNYQPGFRATDAPVGSQAFFDEVTEQRYKLEPHIFDAVGFDRWAGCDVLEAGCGVGTDGAHFAAAGARYTGLDFSDTALSLARRRFSLANVPGEFVASSIVDLPFPDNTFDLVYSHGVIHHVQDTATAVREFHRVLRPGGTVVVMVYHRRSFNYYLSLMVLRRMLAGVLLVPKGAKLLSRVTGEPEEVLAGHQQLLRQHGARYILDRRLFLSNNTDGPFNPLSKVYSRKEVRDLFDPYFRDITTKVRYLNIRLYPMGERFSKTAVASQVERSIGWHLYVEATKGRS